MYILAEIADFLNLLLFSAHVESSIWNLLTDSGNYDGAIGSRKFDDVFIRVDTLHECDGETDGQTPADG